MSSRETIPLNNDPRRLSGAIGFSLLFFGAALLAVVAYAGWSANRTAAERERQLVENALDQAVSRVLNEEKAIAWWDDAVLNAQARPLDIEWLETNIGVYFYETYGHDEVYVVDGDNRPIYANVEGEFQQRPEQAFSAHATELNRVILAARGVRDDTLVQRDGTFTADQQRYSFLLGARDAGWSGHILSVDGAPAVVSAMAIVPSVDAATLVGEPHLMVSIVRMDEEFMVSVGRTLLMPDLALSAASTHTSDATSVRFAADDGAPLGHLSWTPRRPGRTLLLFILPLVAIGVVLAGLQTWLMIRRLKYASNDLADREAQSRHQALHDALSGLPNRHHFVQLLQEALDGLTVTRNNMSIIVAYIDVDRFKDINDTLGHHAGDALIMAVAERLRLAIGADDFLSRFGGDEFAVMRRAANPEQGEDLCERLRRAFDASFDIHGQDVRMTASIGIAMAPGHGLSPLDLMRNADIALYRAKDAGRDRVMTFSGEMAAEVERRREIELDLHDALANGQLCLHYQPLISCVDGG